MRAAIVAFHILVDGLGILVSLGLDRDTIRGLSLWLPLRLIEFMQSFTVNACSRHRDLRIGPYPPLALGLSIRRGDALTRASSATLQLLATLS